MDDDNLDIELRNLRVSDARTYWAVERAVMLWMANEPLETGDQLVFSRTDVFFLMEFFLANENAKSILGKMLANKVKKFTKFIVGVKSILDSLSID